VIGLSAHDFQQAVAAPEVWLCRARRDAETDTVPSRWLNRLLNLLKGASPESNAAFEEMTRGARDGCAWPRRSCDPRRPTPEPRPAPAPPVRARPSEISVTEVEDLVRDPYKVYARRVLGLRPLDPLRTQPDAALRGSAIHKIPRTVRAGVSERPS
jgi:ATP-dependent helicase/nuclease subunit B